MLALMLTCLFAVVIISTVLSLTDSWLRARFAFGALKRERSLAKAGYVPMVEAKEVRLRQPLHEPRFDPMRNSRAATRSCSRRLPRVQPHPAREAAFSGA